MVPGTVTRVVPQHPLQLLGRQPSPQPSARVLLGSIEERLTKALVQAGARTIWPFATEIEYGSPVTVS